MKLRITDPVRAALVAPSLALVLSGHVLASAPQQGDPDRAFTVLKRKYDKDLNGKISEDEFDRPARVFRRMDVDGDGFLTLEDVKARIQAGKDRKSGRNRRKDKDAEKTEAPDSMGGEMAPGMGDSMMGAAGAEPTPEQVKFFETKVRPVLANQCYSCHSEGGRAKGGLRVDSLHGLLEGGASGAALVRGDAEASAFIEAIRYDDPGFAMPPKNKLKDEEIANLEEWVRMGAPWPTVTPENPLGTIAAKPRADEIPDGESLNREIDIEAGKDYWAFVPVTRPEAPAASGDGWARGDIDLFLLDAMGRAGVEPVDDADDRTWLRRVTYDLTGLPPTPEEIAAYLADRAEGRDGRVVDRLLATDGYAERWGRHWLDVARYAESSGKENNVVYAHAWRYRDWVLEAFRQDMPYDEFLKLQIAGDLMPADSDHESAWNQIATGYLAIGAKGHANRDKRQFQLDMVDEQIDALSQGMLGLTISCARCHDHKFDPIPTKDYYSLAGILLSTNTHYGTPRSPGNNQPGDLITLPEGARVPNGPTMNAKLLELVGRGSEKLAEQNEEAMEKKDMGLLDEDALRRLQQRLRRDQQGVFEDLLSRFDDRGRALPSNRLAMGVSEGDPRDIAVLVRGELDRPGDVVKRRMPQVLSEADPDPIVQGSGRAELAEWIASPENPLTARVWANRVWLHLFGTGIVSTPDNFGAGGSGPTHPELLDWLAAELVANGWSTKSLIREITLSHAYRLDSKGNSSAEAIDPDITTLWRMPERRMESEALRDTMLMVAGTLSPERPVGSATGTIEGSLRSAQFTAILLKDQPVRSVYLPAPRGQVVATLEAFDSPDTEFVTGDRDETTVATQALFLMNDGEVLRLADAFADRLLAMPGNDTARINAGFELAFGRQPSLGERKAVASFLRSYAKDAERLIESKAEPEVGPEVENENSREGRRARRRRERAEERARENAATYGAQPEPLKDARHAAWSAFAQSLFQSAEFRVIG